MLGGYPTKFAADERFSYCNGGFVVLALIAERASGVPFHELVAQRVCEPAGMSETAFLRSDELPGGTALGYLAADGLRTNVLHLPVRGSGDGGIYTTAADVRAFWEASSRADRRARVGRGDDASAKRLARRRSPVRTRLLASRDDGHRDARGLRRGRVVPLAPRSVAGVTATVISNWSNGAWPLVPLLEDYLAG